MLLLAEPRLRSLTARVRAACRAVRVRRTLAILSVAALFSCRRPTADRTNDASADTLGARPIDEAAAKAMSHALLDAYDRADEERVAQVLAPTFVLFDELRLEERDVVLKRLDYNPQPSKFLMEMVKARKPGLALDVSMGQGRNALYLASQGWRVTGIDISDEGIRQAREAAVARKLTIEAINADANTWDYGVEKWDLVVLIYTSCDEKVVRRSLKRGGLVVSERAHKDSVPAIGVETGEFSAQYKDGFRVLRDEVVEDMSDWAWKDRLRQKLVRFAAEKR
jgi:SAM-dependent methyltransferase